MAEKREASYMVSGNTQSMSMQHLKAAFIFNRRKHKSDILEH